MLTELTPDLDGLKGFDGEQNMEGKKVKTGLGDGCFTSVVKSKFYAQGYFSGGL